MSHLQRHHDPAQTLVLLTLLAIYKGNSNRTAAHAHSNGTPISPRTLRHWKTVTHADTYQQIARGVKTHRDKLDYIDQTEKRIRKTEKRLQTVDQRLEPTTAILRRYQYEERIHRLEHEIRQTRATLPTGMEQLLRSGLSSGGQPNRIQLTCAPAHNVPHPRPQQPESQSGNVGAHA